MNKFIIDNQKFSYEIADATIKVSLDGANILTQDNFVQGTNVSLNLLKLILEDKNFFDYAVMVFSGNAKIFRIEAFHKNPIYNHVRFFNKKEIYEAFKEALRSQLIELDDDSRSRYHLLKEMTYIDFYEQLHKDDKYKIVVEGKKYEIAVKVFFELLRIEPLEFASKLKNENEFYGIKKEHFIYALNVYFGHNFLHKNYEFTPNIEKNYETIVNETYVDITAINRKINVNSFIADVELDEEFEDYITSSIKPDFTPLEIALYIYLKLCKVLTYDEEFYASHQKGNPAQKHKDLKRLKELTLKNNSVVCWEFSILYEYLLSKFGIEAGSQIKERDYASLGHTNTEVKCGKYMLVVDAVMGIFTGDLYAVKMNKPLTGITCLNSNASTLKEVKETLDRMYDYVQNEELFEYQEILKGCSIDDLLKQYKRFTDNYKEIPLSERVAVLFEKVNGTKRLTGIDTYSYIKQLGKLFFTREEQNSNIRFVIIKNNTPEENDKEVMPLGVITINQSGFSEIAYENSYFVYSPHAGFEPISYYTLEERFRSKIYQYIDDNKQTIPGITLEKEKKI